MLFTEEHKALRQTAARFIDHEINPYGDQWEKEGMSRPISCLRKWVTWVCWVLRFPLPCLTLAVHKGEAND